MDTTNDGLGSSGNFQASASAYRPYNEVSMTENGGREEYAATALVKFLMSRNISLDIINDSSFRTLLKSIVQCGNDFCVLLENSTIIEKSLWKFEHAMKLYMQMAVDSWSITGCSLMIYDLKERKGVSSSLEQNKLVLGFYCPKAFIFVEVPPSKRVNRYFNYYELRNALKDLVPDLSGLNNNVVQVIDHGPSYLSECQYQARDFSDTKESFGDYPGAANIKCMRQRVQMFWREICKASKWVQSLEKKSDKIYEYIITSELYGKFYKTLKQEKLRLGIIMDLEFELRTWLSQLSKHDRCDLEKDTDVAAIIDNDEFWNDGYELLQALAPIYKIPHLMDTLVPTSGFLGVALDNANDLIESCFERQPLKFEQIWHCFENWMLYSTETDQCAANYLSPAYILKQNAEEYLNLEDETVWEYVYAAADAYDDEEREVVAAEIEAYIMKSSNPFANISVPEVEANHPITLWSKYGGRFPQLQKCAYKFLSQPSCCLCKQVEKHMSKLEGVDNYILRLNALMMEEYTKMGDQIYQPVLV